MKELTKKELNFKLAMVDELLTILDYKSDQLERVLKKPNFYKSIDYNYVEHSKDMLNRVYFYKQILECANEDEFFFLTSGKPKVKKVI